MDIKDVINVSGLSQSEFSRQTGIPLRTVQHWAEGSRSPAPWAIPMIKFWVDNKKQEG